MYNEVNTGVTPPRMMTIRQVAQTGLLTEHALRQMEKQKMKQRTHAGNICADGEKKTACLSGNIVATGGAIIEKP